MYVWAERAVGKLVHIVVLHHVTVTNVNPCLIIHASNAEPSFYPPLSQKDDVLRQGSIMT